MGIFGKEDRTKRILDMPDDVWNAAVEASKNLELPGGDSDEEAVAHGRQAAESIHSYLEYGGLKEVIPKERPMSAEVTLEER